MAGGVCRWSFDRHVSKEQAFYVGVLTRVNDAIIFTSRYDINNFAVTFSYDFNYSKLAKASMGMGGPELSIQYAGNFASARKKKIYCPKI